MVWVPQRISLSVFCWGSPGVQNLAMQRVERLVAIFFFP